MSPGLEPANPGRDGGLIDKVKGLDGNEIVKQATDVVVRKLAGTWTEQEAVDESAAHPGQDGRAWLLPHRRPRPPGAGGEGQGGSSAQVTTGPFPNPVTPQPGSAVTVTGEQADEDVAMSGVTTGSDGATGMTDQSGKDGAATDGKRSRDGASGAPDLSKPTTTTTSTAHTPDAPGRLPSRDRRQGRDARGAQGTQPEGVEGHQRGGGGGSVSPTRRGVRPVSGRANGSVALPQKKREGEAVSFQTVTNVSDLEAELPGEAPPAAGA